MDTYNEKGSNKTNLWPMPGANAVDILKANYYVMIASDLFRIPGFQVFYQEWIRNTESGKNKQIYIPSLELGNVSIPSSYSGLKILQFTGCDDYTSFFKYLKRMGNWLFLTGDVTKIESIIKISKEIGMHLRVYRLDQNGKLKNCNIYGKNKQQVSGKSVVHADSFDLPKQITTISKVVRKTQNVPQKGDVVYTSENSFIRLGNEFLSNPYSITYQTDRQGIQAKIYTVSWLTTTYFYDKVKRMLEKPIQCEGICWPIDLLHDAYGDFVGILVPETKGFQLKQQLMSQQGLEKNFPNWDRRNLTHLTKVILDKIVFLQERNVLFGLLNLNAIFVKDEDHVYFADMDTYQIEGYPVLSSERVMQAPELQGVREGLRLYTKEQDNYEVALLTFMLLMPGKFPYIKGKNKNVSESVEKMSFAFGYGKQGREYGSREYFGLWRFAWSHLGNDLKQAFYNTFQKDQSFSIPEKRKDARFWQNKVSNLERELADPYDKESLKIFPRTFKRFSGTKTIQCDKCGIEHPDFYYRYPEKKICNSCLGQPSETHFICKSCGKAFYYDYGTLFKYQKLVREKDFSMPTHCPYCRSDKLGCRDCGKMVPAYRINDKGICIDCAQKIVKRYSCECKCGRMIELTQGEIDFNMNKFGRLPKRCKQCRQNRRSGY